MSSLDPKKAVIFNTTKGDSHEKIDGIRRNIQ